MKFIFATLTAIIFFSVSFGQTSTPTAADKIDAELRQLFNDAETDFAPIRGDIANRNTEEITYKTIKNYFQSEGYVSTLKFYSEARIDEFLLSGNGKSAEKIFERATHLLGLGTEKKAGSNSDEFVVDGQRIAQFMKQGDKYFLWFYTNREAWKRANYQIKFIVGELEFDYFKLPVLPEKDETKNYESLAKQCDELFYGKKEFVKAIEICTEAIKLKGDNADLYQIRGLSYYFAPDKPKSGLDAMTSFGSENKNAALADLKKCTVLAPTKADCFYTLGYVQLQELQKNELEIAAKSFSEAIRLKSTREDVYFQRGEAYREFYSRDEFFGNKDAQIRHRKELAVADYTKDIELRPKSYDSLIGRGLVYVDLEKYDPAVADFTKALALLNSSAEQNPDDRKGILENRARAFTALGKNKEACQDLKTIGKACD